jgi:hypothetical protein
VVIEPSRDDQPVVSIIWGPGLPRQIFETNGDLAASIPPLKALIDEAIQSLSDPGGLAGNRL